MTNDKRTKADVVRKVNSILERMPPHNGYETVPRKFLVQVQAALTMPYTHRNGETTPPSETGRYWFRGLFTTSYKDINVAAEIDVIAADNFGLMAWCPPYEYHEDIESFNGQWWGPVLAPWEELQP